MSGAEPRRYDVARVGAGPVGSLCALAHARNGCSVVVLEANPNTSKRLAGEWLHPPAMRILSELGIEPDGDTGCTPGKGFVVFPEDGGEPILLPYPDGRHGVAWEHERLVSRLRQAVEGEPGADLMLNARVRGIEGDRVSFTRNGEAGSIAARLIVGADGRSSVVRRSLGLSTRPQTCSRMLGVTLNGVRLPFEGYGHVICAEPSPILVYRLGKRSVRLLVDLPAGHSNRQTMGALARLYADSLPDALGSAFLDALRMRRFHAATNALRPRHTYGTPGRVLIGDAAGHYHPLTAVGMTLGFGDAFTLADGDDFRDFARKRTQETRAPELLAMGLYEVFADHSVEAVALRRTIYRQWRERPAVRDRTIRLLACEDTSVVKPGLGSRDGSDPGGRAGDHAVLQALHLAPDTPPGARARGSHSVARSRDATAPPGGHRRCEAGTCAGDPLRRVSGLHAAARHRSRPHRGARPAGCLPGAQERDRAPVEPPGRRRLLGG